MADATTHDLVLLLILYVILPLWGVTGFVDWVCHRATDIENTSGLKEALIHVLMGVQVAIPIAVGILFEMNVLVFLMCLAALVAHEVVAHFDVKTTMHERVISIWEVHAHNYLSTIPFYLIALIGVRNPDTVIKTFTFDWAGEMVLLLRSEPVGGGAYLPWYVCFMGVICLLPYTEEVFRCWRVSLQKKEGQ
jgi:hypothetical protein